MLLARSHAYPPTNTLREPAMSTITKTAQGEVRGTTIQLDAATGLPDGQRVEITIRLAPPNAPWGEGIRRSAGVAADVPGFDEAFDQIERERKAARFRDDSE